MADITINLDQYNLLYENAAKFDMIVEAVKANIDNDDLEPVKEDEILLITDLKRYQRERIQAMANRAASKIAKPEEDTDDAEDQTEL